jgi:UDP-hydrolysing UDP-N-acetyl-D-glucosamine 2-epimerase
MTHVAWVTTCRSDYTPAYWALRQVASDRRTRLSLIVGGAHLDPECGSTIDEIRGDGFVIAEELRYGGAATAAAASRALVEMARVLAGLGPDLVVVLGDRWELLPIASACVLGRVPIVHLCGGDLTEGAIDDAVRHAMTKLAHVHLTSSERSSRRVRQMGEEPWRVHTVGDPALDHFVSGTAASPDELATILGFRPDERTLLVALHPTTLAADNGARELDAVAAAALAHDGTVVLTGPAPDEGAEAIRARWRRLAAERRGAVFVESLGGHRYRGLLRAVGAMVGNSSSGLIEAPCVGLPVVNVGPRQAGRDRAANVIDVDGDAAAVCAGLRRAFDPTFRASLAGIVSPYGDGRAAPRICELLATAPPRDRLLRKRFVVHEVSPRSTEDGGWSSFGSP